MALAVVACLLAAGYGFRQPLRERWLRSLSTDSLRERSESDGADALVNFVYARRLVDSGKAEDAWGPARRAAALLPPSANDRFAGRVLALAGYLGARFGDDGQAEGCLNRAAGIQTGYVQVALGRGILAMRRERPTDAIIQFTEAARIAPSDSEAWTRLGTAYLESGQPRLAIDPLRRAAALAPDSAECHADLGEALGRAQMFAEAAGEYGRAAALAPDNQEYHVQLATAQASAARTDSDYAAAVHTVQDALTRTPQDDGLHALLAGLHMRFCRFAEARRELEACLALNPSNVDAWYNLATVCNRLADHTASAAAMGRFNGLISAATDLVDLKQQALVHPQDARLHLHLSQVLRRAGDDRGAYAELARAAELKPDDPGIARTLAGARAYMASGAGQGAGAE